jgi:hypothetical protein
MFPGKLDKLDNYYKLDAKIEFQKYLILGIIAVAGYFGYNKFIDLDKEADKIKNLEKSFETLDIKYIEAQKNLERLITQNAQYEKLYADREKDLMKLDYKIQDATRQIPESNIRSLALLLSQTYLSLILDHGPYADHITYTDDYINKESEKIIRLLKSAGFSSSESTDLIKEITKDTWMDGKLKLNN